MLESKFDHTCTACGSGVACRKRPSQLRIAQGRFQDHVSVGVGGGWGGQRGQGAFRFQVRWDSALASRQAPLRNISFQGRTLALHLRESVNDVASKP